MVTDRDAPSVALLGEPLAVFATYDEPVLTARTMKVDLGGSEFNTAIGLARLGLAPTLYTALGGDQLSQRVQEVALSEGVRLKAKRIDGFSIGAMVKDGYGRGADTFYLRNESAFANADVGELGLPSDLLRSRPRWCHTTGISWAVNSAGVEAFVAAAEESGATISFDANLRPSLLSKGDARAMYETLAPVVDVWMTSQDEAIQMTGATSASQAAEVFATTGSRAVMRHGSDPIIVIDGSSVTAIEVDVVEEVDPIGAGDAFNAGLIAGLMSDRGLEDACRLGALLGSEMVQRLGDWGFAARDIAQVPSAGEGA